MQEARGQDIAAPELDLIHPKAKVRRDKMRELKICINGSADPTKRRGARGVEHGPVAEGQTKCDRCIEIAKRSR